MLTKDQVSAALDEPAADGVQHQIFDTFECEWKPASGNNGTVTLDVGPWSGNPGVEPLVTHTPVPGVGDEASSDNTGLYVRKGTKGFRIWVFSATGGLTTQLEKERQLAATILREI